MPASNVPSDDGRPLAVHLLWFRIASMEWLHGCQSTATVSIDSPRRFLRLVVGD